MRRSLRRMALAGLAVLLVAAVGFSGALASTTHHKPSSSIKKEPFGSVGGTAVDIYTLTNSNGMEVKILTYGGIIQSVKVPDRRKHFENVTLGFDNLTDYVERSPYFGCITGRYANRIALGKFTLDGVTYQLPINNAPNSLHGGTVGFDKHVWAATVIQNHDGVVSPLNRCQKYVRSFRYRPVHTHHLSPIPSGKPSRLGPDGSHQIGTISIGRMMLKSLFDRAACGR